MLVQQKYDRGDIRRLNAVSVLNQLRSNGAQSRAKIASALGLTRATVSNIVAELIAASIVHETEYVTGEAGRPGLLVRLNANYGCMLAVDLDLDRTTVVLANVGQEILWRESRPLSVGAPAQEGLRVVSELIERALEVGQAKHLNCFGICVACAGMVDRLLGQLAYGPTSHWEHVSLRDEWESRFGVPVYVENEAHAGATWGHHYGPRPGVQDLVYLSLGVGLAAGVFVDGVLLRGQQGFAGQVGHTFFADNYVRCSCGKHGCWVTEIGAIAVRRKLVEAGVAIPEDAGANGDWVEWVYERANKGDAAIMNVLQSVGVQLGSGAARLVQTFNPSVLIVGGRLGKLMSLVEPTIQEALFEQTLPIMAKSLQVVVSDSSDNHLMGGLATVFDVLMRNPKLRD
ncbi:MAG: ROK family transcriptional regulator [Puniceicoccaceae bacterium]|nr:MAG: ROK family transcriptional regulator [Puniceicoccaceae bacterium]